MDRNLKAIAEYAASVTFDDLSPASRNLIVRHHFDGIGCAAGAFATEPVRIARQIAGSVQMAGGCTAFGLAHPTTPEYAAFANGSAVRHLDFNDTYQVGKGAGGHPNDVAPAVLAAVEMTGGTGKDVILGIHIAYEVFAAMTNAVKLRARGIDQGASIAIGTAAAIGRILGLSAREIGHAIAMTMVPATPIRVTRAGELSHWKGSATAHATMTAMFGARLAKLGMTGPAEPFHGVDGFCNLAGPFEITDIGAPRDGRSAIETTAIKYFPAEFNSQGPITLMLDLRKRFRIEDLQSIDIHTYHLAWHEIGGGQGDVAEKWNPQTRESADHSLPYLMAVALTDGPVTMDSFAPARVQDPGLRPLMKLIRVHDDKEMTERYARTNEPASRIDIRLRDGTRITETVTNFRGHFRNRMSDEEVRFKFDSMIGHVLPETDARAFSKALWDLEVLTSVSEITRYMKLWTER